MAAQAMWAAAALMWAAGAVLALPMGYLALLTLASGVAAPPRGGRATHFAWVVPAHNEAGQIGQTVASLQAVAYPKNLFEIWVVADNCTDATAQEAAAAGATVLERTHATERGKGYALDFAFERIILGGVAQAVVVVDADTVVSPNLLSAFAARIEAGAQALQADYGVRNPDASWRTRLMAVALGMFHRLRSLGRLRLGVSCGLRGNGMGFTCALLTAHPHRAHSLVEDVEYGIALGRAGVPVVYVDEAKVLGEMVSGAAASESQRSRWEGGRRALVRASLGPLWRDAWAHRSALLADLAVDLMVPPLSYLGLGVAVGAAALGALVAAGQWTGEPLPGAPHLIGLWAAVAALLAAYVARGTVLSSVGWRGFGALAWAPFYILWKVALMAKPSAKANDWVRTQREKK